MTQEEINNIKVGDLIKLSPISNDIKSYYECDIDHIFYYVTRVTDNSILVIGNVNGSKNEFIIKKKDLTNSAYSKAYPSHRRVSFKKQLIKHIMNEYYLNQYLYKIIYIPHFRDFKHEHTTNNLEGIAGIHSFSFIFIPQNEVKEPMYDDCIQYEGNTYYFKMYFNVNIAYLFNPFEDALKLRRSRKYFPISLRELKDIEIICDSINAETDENEQQSIIYKLNNYISKINENLIHELYRGLKIWEL